MAPIDTKPPSHTAYDMETMMKWSESLKDGVKNHRVVDATLRAVLFATTNVALIAMITSKETKMIPISPAMKVLEYILLEYILYVQCNRPIGPSPVCIASRATHSLEGSLSLLVPGPSELGFNDFPSMAIATRYSITAKTDSSLFNLTKGRRHNSQMENTLPTYPIILKMISSIQKYLLLLLLLMATYSSPSLHAEFDMTDLYFPARPYIEIFFIGISGHSYYRGHNSISDKYANTERF
ncbi:hypothetical protein Tco_1269723 [Tanacetum coccineum]